MEAALKEADRITHGGDLGDEKPQTDAEIQDRINDQLDELLCEDDFTFTDTLLEYCDADEVESAIASLMKSHWLKSSLGKASAVNSLIEIIDHALEKRVA